MALALWTHYSIIDLDPTRGSVYGKQKGKTEGSAKRSGDPGGPGGTDTHPGARGDGHPLRPLAPEHAFTAPRARSTPLRSLAPEARLYGPCASVRPSLRPKHAFTAPSARSTPLR